VEELLASRTQGARSVLVSSALPPAARAALERLASAAKVPLSLASPEEIRRRTGEREGGHAAAEMEPFRYLDVDEWLPSLPPRAGAFLLDGVTDPQNLGSILRSARAFGLAGVVVPKDRSCPVTGAVYRASAGAAAHVPLVQVTNLARAVERLKEERFWVYAAEGGGEADLSSFEAPERCAVVLGSEGEGVRRLVRERCDGALRIAMAPGAESLNVGVAAGIFAWRIRNSLTTS
jgi:23S rRNA (guanosine2251-2'-O)-methyltransferase